MEAQHSIALTQCFGTTCLLNLDIVMDCKCGSKGLTLLVHTFLQCHTTITISTTPFSRSVIFPTHIQ